MTKIILHKHYTLGLCCIVIYSFCIFYSCKMDNKINPQDKIEEPVFYTSDQENVIAKSTAELYYNIEKFKKVTLSKNLLEISGLSIDHTSNELYAVNDEKAIIFKMNTEGEILSKVDFGKNGDYEGIEKVGDRVFVLKSNGKIVEYNLADSKRVDIYNNPLTLTNDTEGLGYDPSTHSLLIACKGSPVLENAPKLKKTKAVYVFDIDTKKLKANPVLKISDSEIESYLDNKYRGKLSEKKYKKKLNRGRKFAPSAIAHNPIDDLYYLLSTLGKLLIVVDGKSEIGTIYFLDDAAYIQPEGICFDKAGNMFISNEGKGLKSNILKIDRLN